MSDKETTPSTEVQEPKEETPAPEISQEEEKAETPADLEEEKKEFEGDDEAETEDLTDEQLMEEAKKSKADGNTQFKDGNLMEALKKYREAVMSLDELEDDSTDEAKDLRKTFNLNIATVLKKMEKWSEVIKSTTAALEIDEHNVKALFFRAIASRNIKDFDTAVNDIKTAIKASPKDKALRKEYEIIKKEKKEYISSQKGLFSQAFSSGLYAEKEDPVRKEGFSEVPAYNPENPKVFFDVKIGESEPQKVIFELFADKTPKTAENFRAITAGHELEDGTKLHYKSNKFHRIIPNFMAQGGDITMGNGTGGRSIYSEKFDDEQIWIPHSEKGLLSMANAGPNTNGSQFFITFVETPHLDGKHTVFGRVIKGWETVKAMEGVKTGANDVPEDPVEIVDCGEYAEALEEADLDLTKE
ncbi:unnamed protein product [Moneuplotes crassus]|uniref:peptidylprolyl isomerase n=1 Tax=Euplotes crassus TaxID=5936 RepID=A0AAD1XE15_EUPCR|nr:unnamed protein product [Moneuplotes crassus]